MDFKSMKRKELQALCKRHGFPANSTNSKMIEDLSSIVQNQDDVKPKGCLKGSGGRTSGDSGIVLKKKVSFLVEDEEECMVEEITRNPIGNSKRKSVFNNVIGVGTRSTRSRGLAEAVLWSPVIEKEKKESLRDGTEDARQNGEPVSSKVLSTKSLRKRVVVVGGDEESANDQKSLGNQERKNSNKMEEIEKTASLLEEDADTGRKNLGKRSRGGDFVREERPIRRSRRIHPKSEENATIEEVDVDRSKKRRKGDTGSCIIERGVDEEIQMANRTKGMVLNCNVMRPEGVNNVDGPKIEQSQGKTRASKRGGPTISALAGEVVTLSTRRSTDSAFLVGKSDEEGEAVKKGRSQKSVGDCEGIEAVAEPIRRSTRSSSALVEDGVTGKSVKGVEVVRKSKSPKEAKFHGLKRGEIIVEHVKRSTHSSLAVAKSEKEGEAVKKVKSHKRVNAHALEEGDLGSLLPDSEAVTEPVKRSTRTSLTLRHDGASLLVGKSVNGGELVKKRKSQRQAAAHGPKGGGSTASLPESEATAEPVRRSTRSSSSLLEIGASLPVVEPVKDVKSHKQGEGCTLKGRAVSMSEDKTVPMRKPTRKSSKLLEDEPHLPATGKLIDGEEATEHEKPERQQRAPASKLRDSTAFLQENEAATEPERRSACGSSKLLDIETSISSEDKAGDHNDAFIGGNSCKITEEHTSKTENSVATLLGNKSTTTSSRRSTCSSLKLVEDESLPKVENFGLGNHSKKNKSGKQSRNCDLAVSVPGNEALNAPSRISTPSSSKSNGVISVSASPFAAFSFELSIDVESGNAETEVNDAGGQNVSEIKQSVVDVEQGTLLVGSFKDLDDVFQGSQIKENESSVLELAGKGKGALSFDIEGTSDIDENATEQLRCSNLFPIEPTSTIKANRELAFVHSPASLKSSVRLSTKCDTEICTMTHAEEPVSAVEVGGQCEDILTGCEEMHVSSPYFPKKSSEPSLRIDSHASRGIVVEEPRLKAEIHDTSDDGFEGSEETDIVARTLVCKSSEELTLTLAPVTEADPETDLEEHDLKVDDVLAENEATKIFDARAYDTEASSSPLCDINLEGSDSKVGVNDARSRGTEQNAATTTAGSVLSCKFPGILLPTSINEASSHFDLGRPDLEVDTPGMTEKASSSNGLLIEASDIECKSVEGSMTVDRNAGNAFTVPRIFNNDIENCKTDLEIILKTQFEQGECDIAKKIEAVACDRGSQLFEADLEVIKETWVSLTAPVTATDGLKAEDDKKNAEKNENEQNSSSPWESCAFEGTQSSPEETVDANQSDFTESSCDMEQADSEKQQRVSFECGFCVENNACFVAPAAFMKSGEPLYAVPLECEGEPSAFTVGVSTKVTEDELSTDLRSSTQLLDASSKSGKQMEKDCKLCNAVVESKGYRALSNENISLTDVVVVGGVKKVAEQGDLPSLSCFGEEILPLSNTEAPTLLSYEGSTGEADFQDFPCIQGHKDAACLSGNQEVTVNLTENLRVDFGDRNPKSSVKEHEDAEKHNVIAEGLSETSNIVNKLSDVVLETRLFQEIKGLSRELHTDAIASYSPKYSESVTLEQCTSWEGLGLAASPCTYLPKLSPKSVAKSNNEKEGVNLYLLPGNIREELDNQKDLLAAVGESNKEEQVQNSSTKPESILGGTTTAEKTTPSKPESTHLIFADTSECRESLLSRKSSPRHTSSFEKHETVYITELSEPGTEDAESANDLDVEAELGIAHNGNISVSGHGHDLEVLSEKLNKCQGASESFEQASKEAGGAHNEYLLHMIGEAAGSVNVNAQLGKCEYHEENSGHGRCEEISEGNSIEMLAIGEAEMKGIVSGSSDAIIEFACPQECEMSSKAKNVSLAFAKSFAGVDSRAPFFPQQSEDLDNSRILLQQTSEVSIFSKDGKFAAVDGIKIECTAAESKLDKAVTPILKVDCLSSDIDVNKDSEDATNLSDRQEGTVNVRGNGGVDFVDRSPKSLSMEHEDVEYLNVIEVQQETSNIANKLTDFEFETSRELGAVISEDMDIASLEIEANIGSDNSAVINEAYGVEPDKVDHLDKVGQEHEEAFLFQEIKGAADLPTDENASPPTLNNPVPSLLKMHGVPSNEEPMDNENCEKASAPHVDNGEKVPAEDKDNSDIASVEDESLNAGDFSSTTNLIPLATQHVQGVPSLLKMHVVLSNEKQLEKVPAEGKDNSGKGTVEAETRNAGDFPLSTNFIALTAEQVQGESAAFEPSTFSWESIGLVESPGMHIAKLSQKKFIAKSNNEAEVEEKMELIPCNVHEVLDNEEDFAPIGESRYVEIAQASLIKPESILEATLTVEEPVSSTHPSTYEMLADTFECKESGLHKISSSGRIKPVAKHEKELSEPGSDNADGANNVELDETSNYTAIIAGANRGEAEHAVGNINIFLSGMDEDLEFIDEEANKCQGTFKSFELACNVEEALVATPETLAEDMDNKAADSMKDNALMGEWEQRAENFGTDRCGEFSGEVSAEPLAIGEDEMKGDVVPMYNAESEEACSYKCELSAKAENLSGAPTKSMESPVAYSAQQSEGSDYRRILILRTPEVSNFSMDEEFADVDIKTDCSATDENKFEERITAIQTVDWSSCDSVTNKEQNKQSTRHQFEGSKECAQSSTTIREIKPYSLIDDVIRNKENAVGLKMDSAIKQRSAISNSGRRPLQTVKRHKDEH